MDDGTTDDEAPGRKPFAAIVQEHRTGLLHRELSDGLAELVAAVIEHGRQGTLTLTMTVRRNQDGHTVTVTDDVRVKAPEPLKMGALYFADDWGNLSRDNPRQTQIPLREAPAPAPVRDLPDEKEGGKA